MQYGGNDPIGPFPMLPEEQSDCCVACHLSWEEQYVLPLLPRALAQRILGEHDWLRAHRRIMGAWPRRALIRHAEWEDGVLPALLPPRVLAKLHADHTVLDYKIRNGLPLDD
jgi:hypothetical protein